MLGIVANLSPHLSRRNLFLTIGLTTLDPLLPRHTFTDRPICLPSETLLAHRLTKPDLLRRALPIHLLGRGSRRRRRVKRGTQLTGFLCGGLRYCLYGFVSGLG
jgi:hypothetical protein